MTYFIMQYPTDEWHQVGIIKKVNGLFVFVFFFFWASKAINSIKSKKKKKLTEEDGP